jgi:hypothetical protein
MTLVELFSPFLLCAALGFLGHLFSKAMLPAARVHSRAFYPAGGAFLSNLRDL